MKNKSFGFTLIELMTTIVIVGILASISLPSYIAYTRRARYSEIVLATDPFRIGVNLCYQSTFNLTSCTSLTTGVNNDVPTSMGADGLVNSITVTNGVITATPISSNGILSTDTGILTPTVGANSNRLLWSWSGGALSNGYVTN